MVKSQNIYEYKKIKPIQDWDGLDYLLIDNDEDKQNEKIKLVKNRLDEVIIQFNQMAKDFELYKKAFKEHLSGTPVLPLTFDDDITDKTSRQPLN